MVNFLAIQVRLGKITIDKIPAKYKKDVEKILGGAAA